MKRVNLACLLLFAGGLVSNRANAAEGPAEKALRAELQEILRAPELTEAMAGVHVRSVSDGRTIFEHNGAKLFNPASNMKILTTASALNYLGASYRFKTVARRDREMRDGVVHGNLYIKGFGDPTLTTEQMFGFVNDIALSGIKKIKGHLIIDSTYFDNVVEGPGWEQENSDHAYAAPVSSLAVNFSTFTIKVLPGDKVGDEARLQLWPEVPGIELVNTAYTRGAGSRTRLWFGTTSRRGQPITVTVRGAIAVNAHQGKLVRRRVDDPAMFAGHMLMQLLKMRGISVRGRVKRGLMPRRNAIHVAAHWSKPLAEIVSTLNKYSNNFMAESILKTLGAELYGAPGTWEKGSKAIGQLLVELGIQPGTFVLGNGSGLNDVNRVTPAQLTQVLGGMYERFEVRPEFVASLAVAANSGTIVGRFENSPADSRLRAKTGSLSGVSALSGYVITQANEVFAFSVMMNDYEGRARSMWRIQDRIGIALARYRGGGVVATGGPERQPKRP